MSKPPIKWSEIKKRISSLSEREQLALFRDIYELSPETKHFICTKLQTEDEVIHNFGSYYDRALKPFDIHGDLTKEDFLRAKKAIKDFQKASADKDSVVELMLCFVEDGTKFTVEYGDMFEGFYLTLEEVLANLITLLKSPGWKTCYNDNRRKTVLETP